MYILTPVRLYSSHTLFTTLYCFLTLQNVGTDSDSVPLSVDWIGTNLMKDWSLLAVIGIVTKGRFSPGQNVR